MKIVETLGSLKLLGKTSQIFSLITRVTQVSQLFSHFWQLVCATLSTIVQHGSHVCSTCVCPLVGGEVVRAGEDLAAHSAAVGLVAGVEPHVPRQHVGPRERPLAHLTRGSWRHK